jgi:cellulose synthase/poly-beta-1,6-N-acetylglucosamine synthase-like glycosyltransferase
MKINKIFLILFFSIFIILNVVVTLTLSDFSPMALLNFIIFLLLDIGVAYGMTETILALTTSKKDLLRLDSLSKLPKVALIYTTFNDVLPETMARLKDQRYENYDIFILDDSTKEDCSKIVDSFGFKTIRRDNRTGFKAGALNNWIKLYGDDYDYFIILDADSLLDPDFIENMVKYGDHPSNRDVAIFQSKINSYNNTTRFARTLTISTPLANYINDRLINECGTMLSWGHNNLHRTKLIKEVGGFAQKYVSEDYATALTLIQRGYKCKLVDVISYEMMPQTIQTFTKRTVRWSKQSLELLKLNTDNISMNTQLHLFISIYSYSMWGIYCLGILIAIFGYTSSLEDFTVLLAILKGNGVTSFLMNIKNLLYSIYFLNFTFLRIPIALRLGITVKNYIRNLLLSIALSNYMMIDIIKAQILTILGKKVVFDVTDKSSGPGSAKEQMKGLQKINFLILVVIIGMIRNPISILFDFVWLIPLLLSSIIIYILQQEGTVTESAKACRK